MPALPCSELGKDQAFDQHFTHLASEFLARRDHRAQIFDLLARVWVFHHGGDSHLA
jgi:hypothetical protein